MEKLKYAYINHAWVKIATLTGLLLCGIVLANLSGGMPPWAWRFLWHIIPQISFLWGEQGITVLLPLSGLVLLSLAIFILWCVIITLVVKIILHWRQNYYSQLEFARDLQEAEMIAAKELGEQEMWEDDDLTPPLTEEREESPTSASAAASPYTGYAMSRGSRVVGSARMYGASIEPFTNTPPVYRPATMQPATKSQKRSSTRLDASALRQGRSAETMSAHDLDATNSATRAQIIRPQLHLVSSTDEGIEQQDLEENHIRQQRPDRHPHAIWGEEDDIARQETVPPLIEDLTDEELPIGSVAWPTPNNDFVDEQADITRSATAPLTQDESYATQPMPQFSATEKLFRLMVSIGLDPGLVRKDAPNEDSLFAMQGMRVTNVGPSPAGLFVVADGMGGHTHGREASQMAIHGISDVIVPVLLRDVSGQDTEDETEIFRDMLRDGVHRANLAVYRCNREQELTMGTTLTATLIVNGIAYIANVGDSRTYLYRAADGLTQITRDHSVVARMVEAGAITQNDIYTHPQRNQIYRCLGEHVSVEIDMFTVPLQEDDIIIMCSDGLWEMVHDSTLKNIVTASAHNPTQISPILVQAALDQGGADNISVVVVGIVKTEA